MTCYHPVGAWQGGINPSTGKRVIRFSPSGSASKLKPIEVPCGQCIGCRLERSRQWAVRCTHESQLYDENCFVTLTYSPEFLPSDGSLVKSDLQKFLKRLRKRFSDRKIRFFACGEYGDQLSRPHYHLCLFNLDFPDKVLFSQRGDSKTYVSEILNSLWPFGFSTVGLFTFESAAYVARYCTKKITGDSSHDHYSTVDSYTGEYTQRLPEFALMSRRPGIGSSWHNMFFDDLKKDYFHLRSVPMRPPRYYDTLTERTDPALFDFLKSKRMMAAAVNPDSSSDRLAVKEGIKLRKYNSLSRPVHAT